MPESLHSFLIIMYNTKISSADRVKQTLKFGTTSKEWTKKTIYVCMNRRSSCFNGRQNPCLKYHIVTLNCYIISNFTMNIQSMSITNFYCPLCIHTFLILEWRSLCLCRYENFCLIWLLDQFTDINCKICFGMYGTSIACSKDMS